MKILSVCGVCCSSDCRAYKTDCAGCVELGGKIPWAVFYHKEYCPIFQCVQDKGLTSCADCGLAPCHVWFDTRDPDASDEQFAADIAKRLANLAAMKE